ncbi:MAG: hypothetical protein ABIA91_02050 [Patescibacteria group bacterium]
MKTKQEKREELLRKKKIKEKKGGTLAGQILRTKTSNKYAGKVKKMK